jgi:hypothetical protein
MGVDRIMDPVVLLIINQPDQPNPECWFNVYYYGHGFKYSKREYCEEDAFYADIKPKYRIHVRLSDG